MIKKVKEGYKSIVEQREETRRTMQDNRGGEEAPSPSRMFQAS